MVQENENPCSSSERGHMVTISVEGAKDQHPLCHFNQLTILAS